MPALTDDPELEAHVQARLGSTLRDKYRLDSVLGIGGMAAVYAATHRNGRQVAVKLLHPALSANSDARARFAREGLVANKVRHPGVVAVLDDDVTEDGAAFLVMELLEGSTLEELWETHGRRLPLPAVMAVGIALLDILVAAHAAGVVHRDIKPANLFLTHHWQIKILDFGISRLQSIQSATSTQTGVMLGSPAFMSPEQALGRAAEIDQRTDLWAAAASLFTLASGAFVHDAPSGQEMLIRAATTPVRSLAVALPEVPGLISAVIDRALSFRREERWSSAGEMSVALAEASRASFGEEPSMGAFASVLAFVPPAMMPPPPRQPSRASLSSVPPPQATQLTSSTSHFIHPGPVASEKTRRAIVIAGVAALGLIVGFGAVASRFSRASAASEGAAGIVQQPASPIPSAAAAVPVAPPGEVPAAPSVSAATDDLPPLVSATPRPGSAPKAPPASKSVPSRSAVAGGTPAQPAPRQSTFLPPPTAAPPEPCNPPYRTDFFGNKVLKPGCTAP
jgi:serine/threonine-protein kinase